MRRYAFALLLLISALSFTAAAQSGVTLTVWDNLAANAAIQQLDARFQSAHPGVTVVDQSYSADSLASALAQTGAAPDLAAVPPGQIPALVKAGLLLPLNDDAGRYGWSSRYSASLHLENSVGDKLYGLSNRAGLVGMFYNRQAFDSLGLQVPTDWDALEADLDAIQSGGLTPITLAGADAQARVDAVSALVLAYSDIADVNALIARSADATFLTEGDLDGAQNFVDWIDGGDFSPGFSGLTSAAARAEFTGGRSALWLASSDNSVALDDHRVGFFLLPSPVGSPVAPTVAGLSAAYVIRATSPNADLAAQYIDFMTGPSAAAALLAANVLPATAVDPAALTPGTLVADLVSAWNAVGAANEIGYPLDQVIPDISTRIRALAAEQVTPEQFVDDVEQEYEAGR